MDSKKILEKLLSIATKQQQAIEKLAQVMPTATPMPAPTAHNPREAQTILSSLPPGVKATVAILEVHGDTVKVRFHPGKGSDAAFQAIQNVVHTLQAQNKLMGKNYTVSEV